MGMQRPRGLGTTVLAREAVPLEYRLAPFPVRPGTIGTGRATAPPGGVVRTLPGVSHAGHRAEARGPAAGPPLVLFPAPFANAPPVRDVVRVRRSPPRGRRPGILAGLRAELARRSHALERPVTLTTDQAVLGPIGGITQ